MDSRLEGVFESVFKWGLKNGLGGIKKVGTA